MDQEMPSEIYLTIRTILAKTIPYLAEKGLPNPRLEADLMLAWVLDLPRVKLYSDSDRPLNAAEVEHYREILRKRVQGWPLAYLTGKKSFLSWDFIVTPAVLIPRPETELLVEKVVELFKQKLPLRGIDVGTGSGVIAVSLAKLLPESEWWATDLAEDALAVARENARQLKVDDRLHFVQGDLLRPFQEETRRFEVIVSNPPYIPRRVMDGLQPEVRREPLTALDGGPDGLDLYRRLIPQAGQLLCDQGLLVMEHGYDQRVALTEMMQAEGLEVQALQDLAGLDRVIMGRKI